MQIRPKSRFLLILYAISAGNLFGQSCIENLYAAGKLLDAGNSKGCVELVRPCSGKDKDESVRWQSHRLMSIAFLLQGNNDSARINGEQMLQLNPTYTVNPLKDPKEFVNLLNSIVVMPEYTLGLAISAGSNITYPTITHGYIVADYSKKYSAKKSTQFGTNLGFYFTPNWKLDAGLFATTKSYAINYQLGNWNMNYTENLTYLELPVMAKYILRPDKRLRIFGGAGLFAGTLLYAQNSISAGNKPTNENYSIKNMNSMNRRNKFNGGLCGGLGLYYKLKSGQINLEANYFHSLKGITKVSSRYSYTDLIYNYFYVDDDIILNNLTFNFGYCFFLNYKVYHKK